MQLDNSLQEQWLGIIKQYYNDSTFEEAWRSLSELEKELVQKRFLKILQEQFIQMYDLSGGSESEELFLNFMKQLYTKPDVLNEHLTKRHKLKWWSYNSYEQKIQIAFNNMFYIGDINNRL